MTHNRQHIEHHHAGDAGVYPVVVRHPNGDRIDITGAEIEWHLKESRTQADADALLSKTTSGGGIEITNGPQGEFEVKIEGETDTDPGETASLVSSNEESASFEWVARTTIDGDRGTIVHGSFQIEVY